MSLTPMKDRVHSDFVRLREQVEFEVDAWLRARGWSSNGGVERIESALQADELLALCKCDDSERDEHDPKCPARRL